MRIIIAAAATLMTSVPAAGQKPVPSAVPYLSVPASVHIPERQDVVGPTGCGFYSSNGLPSIGGFAGNLFTRDSETGNIPADSLFMRVQITDTARTAGSEFLAFTKMPRQPITVSLELIEQNTANNGLLARRKIGTRDATPEEVEMLNRVQEVVRGACEGVQKTMGFTAPTR